MLDNEWNKWIGDTLLNTRYGLPVRFPGIAILAEQNMQPQGQPRPDAQRQVFWHKIHSGKFGQRGIYDRIPNFAGEMGALERQAYQSVFQFNCLAYRYPDANDDTDPQPSDILKACALIFQLPEVIRDLKTNHKAGIISVAQVDAGLRVNDREQFESEPSFDLTVSHTDEFIYGIPKAKALGFNIKRV